MPTSPHYDRISDAIACKYHTIVYFNDPQTMDGAAHKVLKIVVLSPLGVMLHTYTVGNVTLFCSVDQPRTCGASNYLSAAPQFIYPPKNQRRGLPLRLSQETNQRRMNYFATTNSVVTNGWIGQMGVSHTEQPQDKLYIHPPEFLLTVAPRYEGSHRGIYVHVEKAGDRVIVLVFLSQTMIRPCVPFDNLRVTRKPARTTVNHPW